MVFKQDGGSTPVAGLEQGSYIFQFILMFQILCVHIVVVYKDSSQSEAPIKS